MFWKGGSTLLCVELVRTFGLPLLAKLVVMKILNFFYNTYTHTRVGRFAGSVTIYRYLTSTHILRWWIGNGRKDLSSCRGRDGTLLLLLGSGALMVN